MNKHTIHVIVINLLATNYLVVFVFNSHGGKMKKYFCILTLILLQVPCNASVVCEVGVDDLSRTITEEGCSRSAVMVSFTQENGSVVEVYHCPLNSPCLDGYEKLPHPDYAEQCTAGGLTTCGKVTSDWTEDKDRHFITRTYDVVQGGVKTTHIDCRCSQGYYGVTKYNKTLKRCSSNCSACPWHGWTGQQQATTVNPMYDSSDNFIVQACFVLPGEYVDTSGTFEMLDMCFYEE